MLKMTIDNEEVLSKGDFTIKEEMLGTSSTILNNTYPKSWEEDHDYTSKFFYPKDYSKLNIQNFNIEPEEAGKTIQINGSATLTDVDTTKESRVLRLLGQTSQNGTPTPTTPIPVNVVSGDNYIDICGKNLCPDNFTNGVFNNNTGLIIGNDNNHISYEDFINILPNTQYYIKHNHDFNSTGSTSIFEYDENKSFIKRITFKNKNSTDFTTSNTTQYINIGIYDSGGASLSGFECQLEKGSTATTYEPYIGNSYPIYLGVENLFDGVFRQGTHVNTSTTNCLCSTNEMKSVSGKQYTFYTNLPNTFKYKIMNCTSNGTSTTVINDTSYSTSGSVSVNCTADGYLKILVKKNDDSNLTPSTIAGYTFQVGIGTNHISTTPIELCKIGTYQDYIYKDNGSWYLHKEIGKDKLGSSNVVYHGVDNYKYQFEFTPSQTSIAKEKIYSTHFYNNSSTQWWTIDNNIYLNGASVVYITSTQYTSITAFNNFTSANDVYVYYPLATPTNTLIEDTTLIEQLEALSS